jgi:hypothetical protein
MKEKLRFVGAACLLAASLFVSLVVQAQHCDQEECTLRSDGKEWCCRLKSESVSTCEYYNDTSKCAVGKAPGAGDGFEIEMD